MQLCTFRHIRLVQASEKGNSVDAFATATLQVRRTRATISSADWTSHRSQIIAWTDHHV